MGSRDGYFIIIYSECVSSGGGNRNRNTDKEKAKEMGGGGGGVETGISSLYILNVFPQLVAATLSTLET